MFCNMEVLSLHQLGLAIERTHISSQEQLLGKELFPQYDHKDIIDVVLACLYFRLHITHSVPVFISTVSHVFLLVGWGFSFYTQSNILAHQSLFAQPLPSWPSLASAPCPPFLPRLFLCLVVVWGFLFVGWFWVLFWFCLVGWLVCFGIFFLKFVQSSVPGRNHQIWKGRMGICR